MDGRNEDEGSGSGGENSRHSEQRSGSEEPGNDDQGNEPSSDTNADQQVITVDDVLRSLDSTLDDPAWCHLEEPFSDSSVSDVSDTMDDDDKHIAKDQMPKVLLKPKPKHKWFVVKEILNREVKGGNYFTDRYYGSLHVVQRLELMYKMEEHCGCVNAINFNQSGTRLISGSDDRAVAIWDWTQGKLLAKFNTGHSGNVFQCKYLNSDELIVTCSRDGQVRLATSAGCCGAYETRLVANHSQPCHKLTTLPHEPHSFLTAGEDALIISVDIRDKKSSRLMHVKEKNKKVSLYSIHANPQTGHEVVVTGDDHYTRIYDRRKIPTDGVAPVKFAPSNIDLGQQLAKEFRSTVDSPCRKLKPCSMYYVTCAVFNYNGTEVIASYNDDDIYMFDAKAASGAGYIHRYEGHRNAQTVKGVNFFGPRSEYIVSGSDCGNIYFWDKETEAIVQFMRGDEDGVINCLEPHPHIPILATSGLDYDVKIWIPSYEQDPPMKGLQRTLRVNKVNRERRSEIGNTPINDTFLRLWNQLNRSGDLRRTILVRPSVLSYPSPDSSSSDSEDFLPI